MIWNWKDYIDAANQAADEVAATSKRTPVNESIHMYDLLKIDEPGQRTDKLSNWRWANTQNAQNQAKDIETAQNAVAKQIDYEIAQQNRAQDREWAIEDAERNQQYAKERFDWQMGLEALGLEEDIRTIETRLANLKPDINEVYSLMQDIKLDIVAATKAGRGDLVEKLRNMLTSIYSNPNYVTAISRQKYDDALSRKQQLEARLKELQEKYSQDPSNTDIKKEIDQIKAALYPKKNKKTDTWSGRRV